MMCEVLKEKIVESGITQGELAKMMGISRRTLNAKLNNKRSFKLEEAKNICVILQITDPKEIFFKR